jgi:hypothetical protein
MCQFEQGFPFTETEQWTVLRLIAKLNWYYLSKPAISDC